MTLAERRIAEDAFHEALYQARLVAVEAGLTSERIEQLLRGEEQFLICGRLEEQRHGRELVPPLVRFLSGGWEAPSLVPMKPPAPPKPVPPVPVTITPG